MAKYYEIGSINEAKAYMAHLILRKRLIEISEALLTLDSSNPRDVMGSPDDLKLRSSMTLFHEVCPEIMTFRKVLDKYYDGQKDQHTLQILSMMKKEK